MKKNWEKESLKKLVEPEKIEELVSSLKKSGKKIVTLNGSFDLLHAGHLQIIYEASLQGNVLIVALNSDSSIRQYKGERRPIIPLKYRCQMMAALQFVDFITYFDELDPRKILEKIKPDIHVNGAEYGEDCIEANTVKAGGGKLYLVKRIDGLSSSSIIEKIKQCD